jgi:pyrroloquinoline quinone biosynthesis protein D
MSLDVAGVPALRRGVRLSRHGPHGPVLLAPERGYLLNDSAHAVVDLIDGVRSVGEIAGLLSRKYGAPGFAFSDVLELVQELARRRLVVSQGAASPAVGR